MIQCTLELKPEFHRPVIRIPEFYNFDALLDTGSMLPVWCASESSLIRLGGEKILDYAPFGGFGGETHGKLYSIPLFQMGKLMYPHMNIIVHDNFFSIAPLILPATMFNNLIYEINNKTHRLNITVPDDESISRNLTIKDEGGHLRVFCTSAA